MKNTRPDIKIPYSAFEKQLEVLAGAILLLGGLLIGISYASLPETIPLHFDFAGKVDRVGPKVGLFKLYAVIASLYLIISVLSRYPRFFNYPTAITPENAEAKYQLARMLLNTIKVEILVILTLIVSAVISTAKGGDFYLMIPAVFILVALIFITTLIFIIKLMKSSA